MFAVVFGNDHHSFPSALNNARRLEIRDIFHYTSRLRGDAIAGVGLRHIDLELIQSPPSTDPEELHMQLCENDIVHDIPLPYYTRSIAFLTNTEPS